MSPVDDGASDISGAHEVFSAQRLFQGHTPSLEKLDIAYWIRWDTPNLPGLRELRIGYWGLVLPTVSEIVAMLAGCPGLEKLELDVCLLALHLLGPQPFPQAELPQLRQLLLIGSHPVHTAAILNHLHCPRLELANIDFLHIVLDSEQVFPMRNHLLQAIKPKFQSMLYGTNQLKLVLGKSGVGFRMERSSSPEPLSINFLKFGFQPVLEWVLEEFPEVSERCATVIIYPQTEPPSDPATSSYGAVRDLIASLRSVEGLLVSTHPEICQIFRDFLRPRDLQSESSHPPIRNIILDGCICPWKEDIVQRLQETESQQGKAPTRPKIIISANTSADLLKEKDSLTFETCLRHSTQRKRRKAGVHQWSTTEEFDQAFRVFDDVVQRFGRMHRIEQPILRQFRNTQRSAVYRIPLETLCFIFVDATGVQADPLEEKDSLGRCHIRRAMAISHVCSRWYNVAISSSALWTALSVDAPRRLIEMALERSGERPLALLATNGPCSHTDGSKKLLKLLSRHTRRWQSARIAVPEYRFRHVISSPAPLLRYLQITPPPDYDPSDTSNFDVILSADQFFEGQTPNLEKLDIAYWIHWGTPNLPSLRELRVGFWGWYYPTVKGVTAMLAGCLRLEKLELDTNLVVSDRLGPHAFSPVELPHLRQLIMVGSHPEPTASILDQIQCPRLELAKIEFYHRMLDAEQISPMTNRLLQAIKPKFQIMLQGLNQLDLVLDNDAVGFRIERSSSPGILSMNLRQFDWRPLLEWALGEFPEVAERCTVVLMHSPTESTWTPATNCYNAVRDLLPSLRSLEGVMVSRHPEVCQIFRDFVHAEDSQSESSRHRTRNIILDGCLCRWKNDIVLTVEDTKSRQGEHSTRPNIIISANTVEDCECCVATRGALRPFVDRMYSRRQLPFKERTNVATFSGVPIFRGGSGSDCEEFIRAVYAYAFEKDKTDDNKWIAAYASTRLSGKALRWYARQDNTVKADWSALQVALLDQYPPSDDEEEDDEADKPKAQP
ncbi:hypothetical protein FRC00_003816 [Tulasnella sp. 408]|nr:hypothetical protein FRC00_003816 [Tulasnella sp. 408]